MKKAQITVFAIVAIILIGIIALVFVLFNRGIDLPGSRGQQESTQVLEQCVNEAVAEAVDRIILNVGLVDKTGLTKEFEYEQVPYLCYTGLYYARCTPQSPILIRFLKQEIIDFITPEVDKCFQNVKTDLESRNYEISLGDLESIDVEILPGKIRTNIVKEYRETRADETRSFSDFEFVYPSPLYILDFVTHEIVSQEATICNSDYVELMRLNPQIEISKFQTGDGVKIYEVKDKDTEQGWRFAIRSCVLATPG
jgi:hypothetical protein